MLSLTAILSAVAVVVSVSPDSSAQTSPSPAGDVRWDKVGVIGTRIAQARDGDTIVIEPGVYREHLRIDKSVKLVGQGRPIIDGAGNGDIVEITAPYVEFTGFTIRDTGIDLDKENAAIRVLAPHARIEDNILQDILFGIDLREAPDCTVRGNSIGGKNLDIARRGDGLRLWRSDRAVVEANTIHDGRDAILWYSKNVIVRGNTSLRCRYGFHLMYSDSVTLQDNELSANSVGIYLMYSKGVTLIGNRLLRNRGPSGYGIGLKEVDQFTIEGNTIAGNRVGIYLDGSPFNPANPGKIFHNTLAFNDIGITILTAVKGNQVWENNFVENLEQVSVQGRGALSGNTFEKADRGNYWSDYVGYDQNQDGIGDYVHESQTLFENLLDKEPKLRILQFSPAQQAIEFVGRALPAVRPEPKFADECPLMAPVELPSVHHHPDSGLLAAAGAGLVAIGVAVLTVASPARLRSRRPPGSQSLSNGGAT